MVPMSASRTKPRRWLPPSKAFTDAEREPIAESRVDMLRDFAGRWMSYGEYITVEFDTEAGTATVIEDHT